MMTNKKVAQIFYEMSELLEIEDVPFKPQAYLRVARSIEELDKDIEDIYKEEGIKSLEKIHGVGKGIAEKIEEYIKTGKIKDHKKLKKKIPVDVLELTAIEGVGSKLVKIFYKELKIRNLEDLEKAARTGKISKLPRSGEKLEQKILRGIEFYKKSHERFLLGEASPLAREIEARLLGLKSAKKVSLMGSLRRKKETIGDLDFLVVSNKPEEVAKFFVAMPEVEDVYSEGLKKVSVRLKNNIDADLRIVKEKSFGSASIYFTGSKDHNIELRKIATKKGYKLNEYGLFKEEKYIVGKTEEEVYKRLGMQWIPEEMRENKGEIELAQKNNLPELIELKDIRGDLQIHTTWSDGLNTMEENAQKAQKLGYEYILITDHTKGLAMTGGLDEKRLLEQGKEIDNLNKKFKGFKILKGAEVNISKDGSLDIGGEDLERLDIVGAAIHSSFNLSKKEQTERLIKAMENPHVDIIFHPTARSLKKRPEIELDMEEIFKTAKRTGTILEIDSSPRRLDLRDDYIMKAREEGLKLIINTDAHSVKQLDYMEFGVGQARRGWCEKKDIINTLPLEKLLKMFHNNKS